jgi:hypothetical protein
MLAAMMLNLGDRGREWTVGGGGTASSSDVETVVTVEENGEWRLEEVDSVCR